MNTKIKKKILSNRAYFDNIGRKFDNTQPLVLNGYMLKRTDTYWNETVLNNLINDIKSKLCLDRNLTLLDLGCGSGFILNKIAPYFKFVIGADLSLEMLRHAARIGVKNGDFCQVDGLKLPFKDEMFDIVLSYSVFSNFPNFEYAKDLLEEVVRVTRPKGEILIGNIPNLDLKEECEHQILALRKKDKNSLLDFTSRAFNFLIRKLISIPSIDVLYYSPDFFLKISNKLGLYCEILSQNIEGNIYSRYRFDARMFRK